MKTTISEATVTNMELRTIKGQNGERSLLVVTATHNTPRGVICDGFEVWGQDKIEELNLEKGKTYDVDCALIGRQWGGQYSYRLQAYAVKPCVQVSVEQQKSEGVQSAF